MVRPVVLHPKSRGELKLASANPADHTLIYEILVRTGLTLLREGIGIVKEIAGQRALDGFRGPEINQQVSIDEFIERTAWTVHHPLGTCKMGPDTDELVMVDPEMRVHSAENLRVIDASIFPDMLGGNINAPTMAFADRAADLMMGNAPLAPMNIAA